MGVRFFCYGDRRGRRFTSYGCGKTPLWLPMVRGVCWWCRQLLVHSAPPTMYTHSGKIIGFLCPVSHYRLPSQANCLQAHARAHAELTQSSRTSSRRAHARAHAELTQSSRRAHAELTAACTAEKPNFVRTWAVHRMDGVEWWCSAPCSQHRRSQGEVRGAPRRKGSVYLDTAHATRDVSARVVRRAVASDCERRRGLERQEPFPRIVASVARGMNGLDPSNE